MTIDEIPKALTDFKRDNLLRGLADDTIKYYDTMLNMFYAALQKLQIYEITQQSIDDYKLYLMSTQKSRVSVNTHLRAVRRFMNFLCLDIKIELIRAERLPKISLGNEDMKKIISAATPMNKYSVIAVLLLSTGMRSATVRSLRTCDVNLSESNLVLRHTKNKRPYVLPLVQEITDLLKVYIALNDKKPNDLLFTTKEGKALNRSTLWRRIAKLFERIGVDKTGVHIFRHTFAKSVCQNGLNNAIILMRLLGHSSIQQAQQYVNLYGNELRDTMEKYNPIFCN